MTRREASTDRSALWDRMLLGVIAAVILYALGLVMIGLFLVIYTILYRRSR